MVNSGITTKRPFDQRAINRFLGQLALEYFRMLDANRIHQYLVRPKERQRAKRMTQVLLQQHSLKKIEQWEAVEGDTTPALAKGVTVTTAEAVNLQ